MRTLAKTAAATAMTIATFTTLGAGTAVAAPVDTGEWHLHDAEGYSDGVVNFYNRSVQISGNVKSNTTGCVRASFIIVWNGGKWFSPHDRTACGRGTGTSKGFNFTYDIPDNASPEGGVDHVKVELLSDEESGWVVFRNTTVDNEARS